MKAPKTLLAFGMTTAMMFSLLPSAYADQPVSASHTSSKAVTVLQSPALPADNVASDKANEEAAARAKISKERAIELAKASADVPADYSLQNISFNTWGATGKTGAWSLSFVKEEQDRYYGNIQVTVNAETGKISHISKYVNDPENRPSFPPKVELQEAKTIAGQLLERYNPELKDAVRYNEDMEKWAKPPLDGNVSYSIKYDRLVNGIPFPGNYIQFTIDSNGNMTQYEYYWEEQLSFEEAASALSQEQALQIIKEQAKPHLNYLMNGNSRGKKWEPALTYSLRNVLLDANSGKFINEAGKPASASVSYSPLTDKPLAPMPPSNLQLTEKQAEEQVRKLLSLPENAELTDAYYNENVDSGVATWNLNWKAPQEGGKDEYWIYASVNSSTGEILSFNKGRPIVLDKESEQQESQLNAETAKKTAIEFVQSLYPHYSNQLAVDEQAFNDFPAEKIRMAESVIVPFKQLINGIPTESEGISVQIDSATGEVSGVWTNLYTSPHPENVPELMDDKEALSLLLSHYDLQLQYVIPMNPGYPVPIIWTKSSTSEEEAKSAKPVYRLVPKHPLDGLFLDASTGQWRSREDGSPANPEKQQASDLENHWARKELQLMMDYNAIDVVDGKVYPDKEITRGEMIKMLVIARNGGGFVPYFDQSRKATFADVGSSSPYFSYVEAAVDANLIDRSQSSFQPDSHMNREELAALLVRALGYSKLAEHPDMFRLSAADADQIQLKGQVALVLGLGILTTSEDGRFQPEQKVSRAQAATSFYRYLEKRATLRDTPIQYY
ncbi:YcdB/YcdC domain-containing protein [Paenibacillus sp. 32O-W]|uniref:YcdB/YcdC domain-containing protein n=1 Tax=Paenibacillus sp. 32O-W TaxID=1695218 RepID=UPI00119E6A46|nr:YcdB/YcdC domain-containing protein [Paenibacillus sp. 32O-W]